jgi:actin-related protein 6
MLVNWDAEKIIWDRVFSPDAMNVSDHVMLLFVTEPQINPSETSLLVTEPYFNLPNIAETYDQMVFEEWEFASYFRCTRECSSWDAEVLQLMSSS